MSVWLQIGHPRVNFGFILDSGGHWGGVGEGGVSIRHGQGTLTVSVIHRDTLEGTNGVQWQYTVQFPEEQWVHVALSVIQNGTMDVFMNAEKHNQAEIVGVPVGLQEPQANGTMHLGKRVDDYTSYANATLDELRIFPVKQSEKVRWVFSEGR